MTRSDDAPLHERLLSRAQEDDLAGYHKDAADLREAAAALRPPEDEPHA